MTDVADAPFDEGLQPERTLLAWRRTALSLAVASAVALRLTIADFGPIAVVGAVAGIVLALGAYIGASSRYRRAHRSLVSTAVLSTGGVTITAVAASAVVLALLALSWLIVA